MGCLVDEYWVCQHCRSLNRAGASKCYSCRNKFGSKPKPPPQSTQTAAPGMPGGPPPPLGSLPAAAQSTPPAYFSRPVALPTPAAQPAAAAVQQSGRHLSSPVAAIERRISAALAVRPVVAVTGLGYVTAGLLGLIFALGGLLTSIGLPAATYALQHADLPAGWAQLSAGQQSGFRSLVGVEVVLALLALATFSVFVGLSTHNTTGLGSEVTLLMPRRAGTIWPRLVWVQIRIAIGLLLPAVLIWYGYELPGLIAAVVAIEIAQRHLDDMLDWLETPAKHLPDLYRKLGTNASKGSPLAALWAILFRVANLAAIGVFLVAPLGLAIATGLTTSGRDFKLWHAAGYGPGQLAVAALAAILAVSVATTLLATIALVLGLVSRQRIRRTMARVGRSRSWLARPGQGTYGPGIMPPPAGAQAAAAAGVGALAGGMYLDEDRMVERLPQGMRPTEYPDDQPGYGPGSPLRAAPGQDPRMDPRLDPRLDPRVDMRPDPRLDPQA